MEMINQNEYIWLWSFLAPFNYLTHKKECLLKFQIVDIFYLFPPKTLFDDNSLTYGVPEQRNQHAVDPPLPSKGHS
jgi:hypothetical protein